MSSSNDLVSRALDSADVVGRQIDEQLQKDLQRELNLATADSTQSSAPSPHGVSSKPRSGEPDPNPEPRTEDDEDSVQSLHMRPRGSSTSSSSSAHLPLTPGGGVRSSSGRPKPRTPAEVELRRKEVMEETQKRNAAVKILWSSQDPKDFPKTLIDAMEVYAPGLYDKRKEPNWKKEYQRVRMNLRNWRRITNPDRHGGQVGKVGVHGGRFKEPGQSNHSHYGMFKTRPRLMDSVLAAARKESVSLTWSVTMGSNGDGPGDTPDVECTNCKLRRSVALRHSLGIDVGHFAKFDFAACDQCSMVWCADCQVPNWQDDHTTWHQVQSRAQGGGVLQLAGNKRKHPESSPGPQGQAASVAPVASSSEVLERILAVGQRQQPPIDPSKSARLQ